MTSCFHQHKCNAVSRLFPFAASSGDERRKTDRERWNSCNKAILISLALAGLCRLFNARDVRCVPIGMRGKPFVASHFAYYGPGPWWHMHMAYRALQQKQVVVFSWLTFCQGFEFLRQLIKANWSAVQSGTLWRQLRINLFSHFKLLGRLEERLISNCLSWTEGCKLGKIKWDAWHVNQGDHHDQQRLIVLISWNVCRFKPHVLPRQATLQIMDASQ